MKHSVYYPQSIGGGRFIVSELRSFLGFKWWRPVPDLYIDYDRLLLEEKNLKLQLKRKGEEVKKEKEGIEKFVQYSLASHQGYSRSLSPNKRKIMRVGTSEIDYQELSFLDEKSEKKSNPRERGPPTVSVHHPSDNIQSAGQKGNQGNNQKGGNKQ